MTRPIKKIEEYGNRGVGNFKDDYAAASPTARAEWHRQQAERLRLSPRWRTPMRNCHHPKDQRWQGRKGWLCCVCWRMFWGTKNKTPKRDIYGQKRYLSDA